MDSSIKLLQYNTCKIHQNEYLQMVCLSCSHNSLACPLCIDMDHHLHEVISLKKFMHNEIPKLYTQKPNLQQVSQQIVSLAISYENLIEKMRKEIGHQINELQIYYRQKSQRLESEMRFICGDFNSPNLQDNVESAKDRIRKNSKIPTNSQLTESIIHVNNAMAQSIQDCCLQIRRIIHSIKQLHNSSICFLLNSQEKSNHIFSPTHCHKSLEIIDKKTIINKYFDNFYHSVIVSPPLTAFRNEVRFKVRKTEHKCVWVGVTDMKSMVSSNFVNTYKTTGSNYWIWQAGGDEEGEFYAENAETHPLIGWNFDIGDIITVRVLYGENGSKQVQFVKNEELQIWTAPIDAGVGLYYVSVSLGDEGESLEIVN